MRRASSAYQQVQEELADRQFLRAGRQIASRALAHYWENQTPTPLRPVIVSVGLTDPVNIGSVFRICDAAACQKIILVDTPVRNMRKLKRVSRRLDEKVPHEFISSSELIVMASKIPHLIAIEITEVTP